MGTETYVFGPFQAIPLQRVLLHRGKPLRVGSRAFDILVVLLEHAGQTLSRAALIARIWPDTTIDEGALRVHVAALRKALDEGDDGRRYIVNVRGEGYRFDVPVTTLSAGPPRSAPPAQPAKGNLPGLLTPLIGRDAIVAAFLEALPRRRLLTVVGPGGVGKTMLALAVAGAAQQNYRHGVWFVELGAVPAADLVPIAVAAALGVPKRGAGGADLAAWLRNRQSLILLDCCEHVIGAAAELAEMLLRCAPDLQIIATSREPLRVEGEWLHRLASLALPPDVPNLTAQEALRYPALRLFDERARAAAQSFELTDADVPVAGEICRKLDGVPLALELAAVRLDAFSLHDLAARLDRPFAILNDGRRTALPRHQTLRATMDWSYGLLTGVEKLVLSRLGVFRGEFTLAAATAVITDSRITPTTVMQCIGDLVDKSLVIADFADGFGYYRLLETTRSYAADVLAKSGETGGMMRLADRLRTEAKWPKAAIAQ